MILITTNEELQTFCSSISQEAFITVDTEFIRETTYYSKLCLIQVGTPTQSAAIDPLARGLDLSPLYDIFLDSSIVKVFHSCVQDMEILIRLMGALPTPVFDTQIAAMACGFGESVSYAVLARELLDVMIDKTCQYTNWMQRPLTDAQLSYALSDVEHLVKIYELLLSDLTKKKRLDWVRQDMEILGDPKFYEVDKERLWRKVKSRNPSRRFLGMVKALVYWREDKAKSLNKPRGYIMKDMLVAELANLMPKKPEDFKRLRDRPNMRYWKEAEIIQISQEIAAMAEKDLPHKPVMKDKPAAYKPIHELLRVLLKQKSIEHDVADRLIATSDDLWDFVLDNDDSLPMLSGWRYELFGKDAIELKRGKLGLTVRNKDLRIIPVK